MDSTVSRLHTLISHPSFHPSTAGKRPLPVRSVKASEWCLRCVRVGTTDAQALWRLSTARVFAAIVRHEKNVLGAATAQQLTCMHYTLFLSVFNRENRAVVRKCDGEISVARRGERVYK